MEFYFNQCFYVMRPLATNPLFMLYFTSPLFLKPFRPQDIQALNMFKLMRKFCTIHNNFIQIVNNGNEIRNFFTTAQKPE